MYRIIIAILVLVAALGCAETPKPRPVALEQSEPTEPKFANELEMLIWYLGHPNFDKRAIAHEKLVEMGKEIMPSLLKAAEKIDTLDHRRQIELVISELRSERQKGEKKRMMVKLSLKKKTYAEKEPVEATVEILNTGDVPLEVTAPLLRKNSIAFRLEWVADISFISGDREQLMQVSDTNRDPWLKENESKLTTFTLEPGKILKDSIDITDMCSKPARYTATALYKWVGVAEFTSNAVTFEVKKAAPPKKSETGKDGDK